METVGQDLRAARLRRGDEIAAVSRALKIRKDHLDALEEDRLEDLPGKTYALGFVRSYAQYLGLDGARMAERFKQEIMGRSEEALHHVAPIHQDDGGLPHGWRLIGLVVIALLGYGAWYLFGQHVDTSQPVPPAPILNPPKPASAPPPKPVVVPPQSATPSPALDSTTVPAGSQASALPTPAAGPQTPATHLPAPGTGPVVAAQTPAQGATPPQKGAVLGQQNANPRVLLRATGPTRITVKGNDGRLYINRDLQAGDVYQVPNVVGLSLAASDAGAVEISLDGQPMGKAGQPQQVVGRVSLEPQSLADRFNR